MASPSTLFQQRQRSNSVAANTMTDAPSVPGRPGFAIVFTGFRARAGGGAAAMYVEASLSDGVSSSVVISNQNSAPAAAGNFAYASMIGEDRIFGEGLGVNCTVTGNGTATGVGYTIDYYYRPVPIGFVS